MALCCWLEKEKKMGNGVETVGVVCEGEAENGGRREEREGRRSFCSLVLAGEKGEMAGACAGWVREKKKNVASGRGLAVQLREKRKFSGGRRRLGVKEIGLGFLFPFFICQNCPPCKNQCSLVFIGKVLLGFQTSPSTFPFLLFSSFFVNFDFSYFFLYF